MTDSKLMERRGDTTTGFAGIPWPAWGNWPSRRWLDEFFRDTASHQMIRVEECREGDAFIVRAEIPGVDPDKDIHVEVFDGALVISADKAERHETGEGHYHRSEFRYGALTRSVTLPKGVDESSITATYKDGVLEVRMTTPPEAARKGTRQIEVKRT
ncbi:MAG: Hsp20/alpha crystallin family protein [Acidobacteriota bacterium]|nr:Hsp20/alpha crystallin family protein [Acidobacteriota bacterium]